MPLEELIDAIVVSVNRRDRTFANPSPKVGAVGIGRVASVTTTPVAAWVSVDLSPQRVRGQKPLLTMTQPALPDQHGWSLGLPTSPGKTSRPGPMRRGEAYEQPD